eukprot:g14850.t1
MVVADGLGSPKDRAIKVRTTRTCNNPTCNKNPYFGWHGEKAVFCVSHKTVGMVDVKNKRCEEEGCMKRGLFGYDGERARFCGTHRLQGMVDLKNKRCKWVGCAKQANFAEEGLTTAAFCLEHRTPGMVDVKGHRCTTENCTKVAGYGVEGGRPTSCLLHRKTGMVDMKQHRPRRPRLPATRKPNGINVKLSGGADGGLPLSERFIGRGAGSAGTSSVPSRGTGSKKGSVAGKPINADSNLMLLPPVSRLDPCPDLDLLRPATYPHLSSSGGGGNSSHPQEHWHSDPTASPNQFGGSNSGNGNKPSINDQPLRSWRQGGSGKSTTSDSSVPTMSGWALNGQLGDGSGSGNSNGGNGGAQQLSSPSYATSSHRQDSSMPPSATSMRGSASLPALNRFDSGGGGSGYFGERSGIDGGGWRSPALSDSLQIPAVSAAIEQPGYGDLSSLGIGRDAGVMSVVKTEQEAIASGELQMPEPESADAWLRDLMHGAIVRDNNNAASQQHQHQRQHQSQQHQQHQQHPIYSSGVVLGTSSNHHMRNPSNSQPLKQDSRGPSYHGSQHQQYQQHQEHQHSSQGQGSVLSLSNVSRTKGSAVTTRTEPTASLSTVAGRSPSAGSSGASPPDEPENFNDPAPQGSYQHDLARAGGGGGNHGLSSMVNLRAGARGAAGPPNHLFTTHLSGISAGGCDRGYGTAGFSSDVNFPPLARVASPTAWGGF